MGYFQGWENAVDAGNAFGELQDKGNYISVYTNLKKGGAYEK